MWALMHLPALLIPEMGVGVGGPLTPASFALGTLLLIAFAMPIRIIAAWLFNNAAQSAFIVGAFHAAMNSTQNQLTNLVPGYNSVFLIGALGVVAVVLIAISRGRLGYERQITPAPSQPQVDSPTQEA
jgi:hypothetical protein